MINQKIMSSKLGSLMLESGNYHISITEHLGKYAINLGKIKEQKETSHLKIEKGNLLEQEIKRGRGRPKLFKPKQLEVVKDEIKKPVGRPRKIMAEQITKQMIMPRKRGRPPKTVQQNIEPAKRAVGRPRKSIM